jgi:RNA polymerase sigma factor (sigma-70 family)
MAVTDLEAGTQPMDGGALAGHAGDPVGAAGSGSAAEADAAGARTIDPQALRRRWKLVLPHREQMLAIARRRVATREDAEDVVATALVRTVEHPKLDEARVGAFLCTTVMRLAVDVHRDRDRQLAVGTREATRALPGPSVEELVCDEAEARWLAEQLQDLPERERQVLQARLSGMTAQQASAHLGLTAKATENAFTRVRQRAHGLLAATLAGLGILFGAGRRFTKPEIALVPAGVATALTLAVVVSGGEPPAPPPAEITLDTDAELADIEAADTAPTEVASLPPVAPASPTPTATAEPSTAATDTSQTAPAAARAEPSPARTQVTNPPMVEEHLGPGSVSVEDRHEDESFEESVQHCLDGAQAVLADPLADPCQ